ncbi:MAG TPA: hypothetical protein PLX60_10870 [Chitinophagales bacterium]|nr:hypothetical protein [Chitinophagales bacterium]
MQAMTQQLIPTTELSFKKQIISIDAHWCHKNVVIYEINKDDKNIATIEINSIFTAKINYNSKTYLIRPKTKFVFIKKLEIFSSEDVKIGEIDYWRWTWLNPLILLFEANQTIEWEFDKNGSFRNRSNNYITFIKSEKNTITYEIEFHNTLDDNTTNNYLKKTNGKIKFIGDSSFITILGVFVNNILIYEDDNI